MAFLTTIDILKECVALIRTIKSIAKDATFLKERCTDLTEHIDAVTEQVVELDKLGKDPGTSKAIASFLGRLHCTLIECYHLIEKCVSMEDIKAGIASITEKASYNDKFNRLEKKLDRLTIPSGLANMVGHSLLNRTFLD